MISTKGSLGSELCEWRRSSAERILGIAKEVAIFDIIIFKKESECNRLLLSSGG